MTNRSWLLILIISAALFGAADAGYLSIIALSGDPLVCNFIAGCDIVARSLYSKVFGIPLSLFGFFFYLAAVGFAAWALRARGLLAAGALVAVSALGVIASLYFMYLQVFIIRAFCEYCLFSALDTVLILALASVFFIKERSESAMGTGYEKSEKDGTLKSI